MPVLTATLRSILAKSLDARPKAIHVVLNGVRPTSAAHAAAGLVEDGHEVLGVRDDEDVRVFGVRTDGETLLRLARDRG
jgi:hypothetical protein